MTISRLLHIIASFARSFISQKWVFQRLTPWATPVASLTSCYCPSHILVSFGPCSVFLAHSIRRTCCHDLPSGEHVPRPPRAHQMRSPRAPWTLSGSLPLSRCLFVHSMAGPLFGPISGAVRCRRSGMAYANRLSLTAPGPGPLAGGRWHKPCPPPGLPLPNTWRPRAAPLAGAPLGPCGLRGGLPSRAPLRAPMGRPCRAAWRLISVLTIGRAPASTWPGSHGGRAPLRARGPPPWAGLPCPAYKPPFAALRAWAWAANCGPGGGLPMGALFQY